MKAGYRAVKKIFQLHYVMLKTFTSCSNLHEDMSCLNLLKNIDAMFKST